MTDAIHSIVTSAARHARMRGVQLHPPKRRPVPAPAVRPVRRGAQRWCVHLHHRDRRLPAGVPVRLHRVPVARRPGPPRPEPASAADRRHCKRPALARPYAAASPLVRDKPSSRLVSGSRGARSTPPAGTALLRSTMTLPTRRPDLTPTTNLARCRRGDRGHPATAEPAEAAVDGTVTTQWIGETAGAKVTVDLGRIHAGRCGHGQPQRTVTTYPATARRRQGCHAPHRQCRRARAGVRRRHDLAHAGHRRRDPAAARLAGDGEPCASCGSSRWAPPPTYR